MGYARDHCAVTFFCGVGVRAPLHTGYIISIPEFFSPLDLAYLFFLLLLLLWLHNGSFSPSSVRIFIFIYVFFCILSRVRF